MDSEIKKVALKKALAILKTLNCQYFIVDETGAEHGERPDSIQRRGAKYGYGALVNHVKSKLEGIAPGQTVEVEVDRFDFDSIQSTTCNYMKVTYGPDSYMTTRLKDKNVIEVLLLDSEARFLEVA